MANAGMTLKDIKPVPCANPIESARAVMEGRADSGDLAVGAPIATEAVAKVKARWLPVDPSPEAVERMKSIVETSYVDLVPGGVHIRAGDDGHHALCFFVPKSCASTKLGGKDCQKDCNRLLNC